MTTLATIHKTTGGVTLEIPVSIGSNASTVKVGIQPISTPDIFKGVDANKVKASVERAVAEAMNTKIFATVEGKNGLEGHSKMLHEVVAAAIAHKIRMTK